MQSAVLLSVCPGIDVGRFVTDEQYKLETILGLAMSVLYYTDCTHIKHTGRVEPLAAVGQKLWARELYTR